MPLGFRQMHGEKAARAAFDVRSRPRVVGPVLEIPAWWVILHGLVRTSCVVAVQMGRHPLLSGFGIGSAYVLIHLGRTTYLVGLASIVAVALVWLLAHRSSSLRCIGWPLIAWRRRFWVYRRGWDAAMATCGLAVGFLDSSYLPQIKRVRCNCYVDSVLVQLVSGQSPEQWEKVTNQLAHTFGTLECKLTVAKPRHVWLHFTRRDALQDPVRAMPIPVVVDLAALSLGMLADGTLWLLRLIGTHLLIAGATGAGKGSVLWSLIRALAPAIRDGSVALWVIDPKGGMELQAGAPMFARFECRSFEAMADLLDDAVTLMQRRQDRLRGKTRQHQPSPNDPLVVIVIDELGALSAYCQDREVKRRVGQSLGLLLSQGRAVGVLVVAAVQDPRKDVIPFRDLFPTRIALRLTEANQVDMVLGDGFRDRGALCDRIHPSLPGVGYVVLDGVREPVRVRAAFVSDDDIDAMADEYRALPRLRAVDDEDEGRAG